VVVLYIGGFGRSGTTLVSRMLGEIPGVCDVGEVVNLFRQGVLLNETCGCGVPFLECAFWHDVGVDAFGGWCDSYARRVLAARADLDRLRMVPRLVSGCLTVAQQGSLAFYNVAHSRIWSAALRVADARVLVDASKHAALAHCLSRCDDQFRIVHLVRDSRAVAFSWSKKVRRPESREVVTYMDRFGPGQSASLWNLNNGALEVLRLSGVSTLRIRYEDLIGDPRRALSHICEFAGLGGPDQNFDFLKSDHVTIGPSHCVAGNPMRFAVGDVPLRVDDEWRASMSPRDRRMVSVLTSPLLRWYGYDVRPSVA
jgi:hypothetical protein